MADAPARFNKDTTCCFTGHRKRDLPFGGDTSTPGMKVLVSTLMLEIEDAVRAGYKTFLTGMAEGVDLICAELVHDLITKGRDIELVCVLPYRKHIREIKNDRDAYVYDMLTELYPSIVLADHYDSDCYRRRNKFMVDNCSRVIGVLKMKPGGSGTYQTVSMARKQGLELRILRLDSNPLYYLENDDDKRRHSDDG
ncbi:MAG: DUF1273 family protein [Ruminococcus sp.]|nr:DUF1273 family protein [Ruminococcus sp.]